MFSVPWCQEYGARTHTWSNCQRDPDEGLVFAYAPPTQLRESLGEVSSALKPSELRIHDDSAAHRGHAGDAPQLPWKAAAEGLLQQLLPGVAGVQIPETHFKVEAGSLSMVI